MHPVARLFLVTTAALLAGLTSARAAVTYTFDSQGFEAVGDGASGTLTDADGAWTVSGLGNASVTGTFIGVRLGFTHDDPQPEHPVWILEFRNDDASELAVGTYTNLGGLGDTTQPRLEVDNDKSCSGDDDSGNSFSVSAIEFDLYGRPVRFAATFVLRCGPGQAPLTGSIDYVFDGNLGVPALSAGNVLAVADSILYEYTPSGVLVQALPVGRGPSPPVFFGLDRRGEEPARDLAMTDDGVLHLFNEQSNLGQFTFADRMSRLSSLAVDGTWRHDVFDDEWNQAISSEAAVTALYPWIFAIDGPVGGDARGIVRFDTSAESSVQRFEAGVSYKDLGIGPGEALYALGVDQNTLTRFDVESLANLGTVTLDQNVQAFAAAADGSFYGIGGTNQVTLYHFDSAGTTQSSLDLESEGLFSFGVTGIDLDLSAEGQLVVGFSESGASNPNADFVVADGALSGATKFEIDPTPNEPVTFVAWAEPAARIFSDGFESGNTGAWSAP